MKTEKEVRAKLKELYIEMKVAENDRKYYTAFIKELQIEWLCWVVGIFVDDIIKKEKEVQE